MTFRLLRTLLSKPKPNYGKFEIVEPGNVSPQLTVPEHIPKPSYYETGDPGPSRDYPEVKTSKQIAGMRDSCKLAANILKTVQEHIRVGQTTDEIDAFVHKLTVSKGAYPSPLNYKLFPKSICTSVNNVACHGVPDDRPLQDGDIISVDITVFYQNYHGDCAKTFLVGSVDAQGRELVKATETCLNEAIELCEPGRKFRDIGEFIEYRAKKLGFRVVPVFIGHGIGEYFHGAPDIYHIRNNYPGVMLPGMTFTIEPVVTQGSHEIVILEDDWTAVTLDMSRTAQFEHTVLVTDKGAEILTLPD